MKNLFSRVSLIVTSIISFLSVSLTSNSNVNTSETQQVSFLKTENVQSLYETSSQTLDENIVVQIASNYTTSISSKLSLRFTVGGDGGSYFIGYVNSKQGIEHIPAVIQYKVKNTSGSIETREANINRSNLNGTDTLGDAGDSSLTMTVDIELQANEELQLDEDVYIFNLVPVTTNESGTYIPKTKDDGTYDYHYTKASKYTLFKEFSLDYIADIRYEGSSSFGEYGSINFNCSAHIENYQSFSSTCKKYYEDNIDDIEDGTSWVRARMYFSSSTKLIATIGDEEVSVTPSAEYVNITSKNSKLELLYKEFNDINNLNGFIISDFSIEYDIYSSETYKRVPKTQIVFSFSKAVFGASDYYDANNNLVDEKEKGTYSINATLIFVLSIIGVVVLYYAISIFMFFYLKKKNAKDEFKRVRPKYYWQNNTIGFITTISLFITIESIILRSTILNNSFEVFNLLDVFIIIFAVLSIIFGGYQIKYFYTQIKNYRQRKKNDRLKLSQDVMDDGTLIMSSNESSKK